MALLFKGLIESGCNACGIKINFQFSNRFSNVPSFYLSKESQHLNRRALIRNGISNWNFTNAAPAINIGNVVMRRNEIVRWTSIGIRWKYKYIRNALTLSGSLTLWSTFFLTVIIPWLKLARTISVRHCRHEILRSKRTIKHPKHSHSRFHKARFCEYLEPGQDNTFKLDRLISSVLISKKSPRRKLFERSKYTRGGEAERERIDEKYIYRCVKRWNKELEWRKVARRRVKRREEPPTAEQRFVALSLKAWMLKHSERIPGVESS